jgi:hypothetical protein
MCALGSLNVLAAWLNYVELSSEKLRYGLVIGPPTFLMWLMLLLFTVVHTVLYIPETLNTFSVFLHEHGRPMFPLIYEMTLTLTTSHIPLAAINYFIARCRRQYTTLYQTMCGSLTIIFFFLRLVWYAHLEGKLLKLDDKRKIKIGFVMTVSSLYAMAMAFYVMSWRSGPNTVLLDDHVKNISIYMLKTPFLENQYIHKYNVDHILNLQGWSLKEPEIVPSVNKITKAGSRGVFVTFRCNDNITFVPYECHGPNNPNNPQPPRSSHTTLLFFFIYAPHSPGGPYGEVRYALGVLHGRGRRCRDTHEELQDGWRLSYFHTLREQHRGSDGVTKPHVFLSNPWQQACTVPRPSYDPELDVCGRYERFIKSGGVLDQSRGGGSVREI